MRTGGNAERLSERIEKMMNQTKKHTTSKKLLALLLALIMTVSLLPMSVFAAAVDVPETEQQVTEPVEEDMQEPEVTDVEGEGDADVQNMEGGAAVYADAAQINYVEKTKSVPLKDGTFYRIVHIDCGRKYFSVTDLKKIIDYAAASNYTHVELAFGNGGLRFVLDDMDIKSGSSTLHYSEDVKAAILQGNERFYNDPNGNALRETEMRKIIDYANGKGIEIVPLLNMPGHMDGLLSSDLFSQYKLSGSEGSLDLNNSYAVDFGKALLKLYVDWFQTNSAQTMHFNFGADEYGQGIRNPYIESGVANVTY